VINGNRGPISHCFRNTAIYGLRRFIKNCGQPAAERETWLLLTTYRKSPAPYPMVPSPIPYDLPFIHNTARLAYHSGLWPFKVIYGK